MDIIRELELTVSTAIARRLDDIRSGVAVRIWQQAHRQVSMHERGLGVSGLAYLSPDQASKVTAELELTIRERIAETDVSMVLRVRVELASIEDVRVPPNPEPR
jgi:hypothetical protein